MHGWIWRHRWGRVGRPSKPRFISIEPRFIQFIPFDANGNRMGDPEPVILYMDEYEAFRLVYHEGLTQDKAALRMGISRGTLWRCLNSARKKIALMLYTPRPLIVSPYVLPQNYRTLGRPSSR